MKILQASMLGLMLLCSSAVAESAPVAAPIARNLVREGEGTVQHPTRILLTGDSLMEGLGPQMKKALDGYANLTLIPIGKKSTGLSRPDFYNWPQVLEKNMVAHKPQIVVMWVGTNDPQNIHGMKGLGEPLSIVWQKAYYSKLMEIVSIVRKHNARLILMGPPIMDEQPLDKQLQGIIRIMDWTCRNNGAQFLNTRPILADANGRYMQRARLQNGKVVDIRTRDHVHITSDGNILVMDKLLPYLSKYLPGNKLHRRSTSAKHRLGSRSSSGIRGTSMPRSSQAVH